MVDVSLQFAEEIDLRGRAITTYDQGGETRIAIATPVETPGYAYDWDQQLTLLSIGVDGSLDIEAEQAYGSDYYYVPRLDASVLDTIDVNGVERIVGQGGGAEAYFISPYATGYAPMSVIQNEDVGHHGTIESFQSASFQAIAGTDLIVQGYYTEYLDFGDVYYTRADFGLVDYDAVGHVDGTAYISEEYDYWDSDYPDGFPEIPSGLTGVSSGSTTYFITGNAPAETIWGDPYSDERHTQSVYSYVDGELSLLAQNDVEMNDNLAAVAVGGAFYLYTYDAAGIASFEIEADGTLTEIERLEGAGDGADRLIVRTFGDHTLVATMTGTENSRLRLYEVAADGTLTPLDEVRTTLDAERTFDDPIDLVARGDTVYAVLTGTTTQLWKIEGITLDTGPAPNSVPTFADDSILGTGRGDIISALSGADTVYGEDGDDRLIGRKGADSLDGGDGDDSLFGGEYHDTLFGREGNDVLLGQSGDDQAFGGKGRDVIYGGAGADALFGDGQSDFLSGDAGDDYILGGRGNDVLFGGSNEDTILGGSGRDAIDGGRGNDTIEGGQGADTLTGGLGQDYFVVTDRFDTITDFEIGLDSVNMVEVVRSARDVRFVQDGADALVTEDGVTLLRLDGVDAADLLRTDFWL